MFGLAVVALFVLVALAAPWLAPHDPLKTSWSAVRHAPSASYWFGADELGRDVFSRIIWGARASILAGVVSVSISLALGVPIGMLAGYLGISATPVFIRLTRAQVLAAKSEDYVEAARALGNPHLRIALRHIFPNIVAPLIVQATLAIAAAVIAEASLSFLGLGQQPPAPSWGSMLNTARNYVDQAPWMAIWPGVSIFLLVLSFNLLGDGLRDALDPRHR
jgi:peptide/nickel transport system permease protein